MKEHPQHLARRLHPALHDHHHHITQATQRTTPKPPPPTTPTAQRNYKPYHPGIIRRGRLR